MRRRNARETIVYFARVCYTDTKEMDERRHRDAE